MANGDVIPAPSPIESLKYGDDPEGGTYAVALVDVVLPLYRSQKTEYSRVNCTIPKWLKEAAEENNVNFSKVLREGLIKALDLERQGYSEE